MDFITAHFSEIVSLVIGLIGGGTIGSLVTFKIVGGQKASSGGSNVNQSGSKAGGDIVGGNKSSR
ncbi:hypothetical protein ELG72_33350 (plasmid) [Rhizobium leguminosarum]|uniref:hypothetical protein n=1 Tax=Rhizobium/Agrobacterium group TaxID=227290 RepID=UPI0010311A45|nr:MULTISPECIES: hypothetical protein [Rhizobium/Agrobacterium group]MDR6821026.1 hypothetical protein [Neorhizobium sp. 2083]TBF43449.1 hypothetical protein ELG91_35065 [Rhizobium leguminosarum]TBF46255.1 hypothetical protein ELG87_33805 [Rhizobium leguminosarum]TBF47672.1 hypothetical protein ELG90_31360 [Rhizobium leguminosarum]TBF65147.1 hypothetical protein ELG84_34330 [Rhizobium leguminosarum]